MTRDRGSFSALFSRRRMGRCSAWLRRAALAGAVVAIQWPGRAPAATTVNWTDGTGNWNTAANWTTISSTHAVPAAGDTVNITASDGVSRAITYNYTGAAISLGALTIDLTNYSGAATITLSMSANSLSVTGAEVVANNGTGNFNESGGTNTINSGFSLIIGYNSGSVGTYTLSGTGALTATGTEYIGYNGTGNFNQSGGTHTLNSGNSLFLGYLGGSTGTYTLSGTGALSVTGTEFVGGSGTGNFNQSGGTNTLSSGTYLYLGASSGSTGTYTLSGTGALSGSSNEYVGYSGTGNFNQTGGTNTLGTGYLYLGYNTGSSGTYTLSGTGVLSVGGQEYVGINGTGNFNQSGGTHTLNSGSALYFGFDSASTGTYTLSGSGTLAMSGYEYIGYSGTGNFNQTGGTHTISLGYGLILSLNSGSGGTYTLSGTGALSVSGNEYIGVGGTGTFNQSGGTNTINVGYSLDLGTSGSSIGTYNLSGGSATVNGSGSVFVGGVLGSGTGILNVSGTGVLTISGALMVYPNTAACAVNLSGGTINTAGLNFNGVPALLNWTGGTLDLTTNVTFDSGAAPTSTANAFGPSLTLGSNQTLMITGNETLGGTGAFGLILNSGSSHYVTGTLTLSPTGTITQNSGSTLYASTFTQAGGTVNGILQNQGTFVYQSGLFNGRLLNQGTVNLGPSFTAGNGMENDSSMTMTSGQTLTVNGAGLSNLGTFTMNGGALSGSGAGVNNYGTFIMNGGVLSGSGPAVNNFGGTLQGYGTINPGFTNNGLLVLSGVLSFTSASPAVNNGIIQGSGTIVGDLANPGGTINVTAGSLLAINSAWTNAGVITMQSSTALLGGGTITNAGTIQGAGEISATIANSAGSIWASGGELELSAAGITNTGGAQIQATSGATVLIIQGLAANAGIISLIGGTFDNNGHTLNNTGQISGYGILRAGGLTNNGIFTLTGGASTVNGNITNNAGQTINIKYQPAIFTGNITNNGTIKVTGTTVTYTGTYTGNAYISDPATNIFQNDVTIVSGGSMTGGSGDQYDFTGGTVTNTGTFSNGGLLQSSVNVTNSGTFTQSGAQTWSGGASFTNSGGSATFASDAGSASSSPLAVTITGGTVNLAATEHLNALTIATGQATITAGTTKINSLALGGTTGAWTGDVDIGGNQLVVEATALTRASVLALLQNQALYGAVNPNGITSDALTVHTGIAVIDNGALGSPLTTFGGVSVDANSLLVAPELFGDASIDGVVNAADFALLASNFNKSNVGWGGGDFNNDGVVNFADFALLSNNFGDTIAADAAASNSDASGVPEPATLILLGAGLLGLAVRRRTRSLSPGNTAIRCYRAVGR